MFNLIFVHPANAVEFGDFSYISRDLRLVRKLKTRVKNWNYVLAVLHCAKNLELFICL